MTHRVELTRLAPLLEILIEESDENTCQRILVHAIACLCEGAVGLCLESQGGWIYARQRGDMDRLPSVAQVAAVVDGELAPELPHGRHVLWAGTAPNRRALGLTGERNEERLDLAESLLLTLELLQPAQEDPRIGGALPPAPLPGETSTEYDLRTALGCLRSVEGLLKHHAQELGEEERERYAAASETESARIAQLLADSALASGAPGTQRCVDAARIVRAVVAAQEADRRRLGVRYHVTIGADAESRGSTLSEPALSRVLHLLLANAGEALEIGTFGIPTIAVELTHAVRDDREGLRFAVEDSGPGVPRNIRHRLFVEAFSAFRPRGRGDSLSRIAELVRDANGSCGHFESSLGGACFEIWLPCEAGPRPDFP